MACALAAVAGVARAEPAGPSQGPAARVTQEYVRIGGEVLPIAILSLGDPRAGARSAGSGGSLNVTTVRQVGDGNVASVTSVGDRTRASLSQEGSGNRGALFLSGDGATMDVVQRGDDNATRLIGGPGTTVTIRQFGSGNAVSGVAPDGRTVSVRQVGDGLSAGIAQAGAPTDIAVSQTRLR